ncbi:hypothetical protein [Nocardioides perillae]|uniref:Integral membrane protein n=1 Tax=Nocardioides perillae TaxID=1119534 RepID=A0A7Y9RWD5_9ACTN|nr:hypothetical protein [Nocardioides perillae]NYG56611.1 hypothetical protein [Nocardioides perillae]
MALVALVLGCAAALVGGVALYAVDDSCPQWEDEGSMAAPGSPYSLVMCGPGAEPPLVWASYAAVGLAVAAAVPLLWRRVRVRSRVAGLLVLVVLVGPVSLIGLLHVGLPRDCLSGRTESGHCSRDRERR